jgi:tRNA dimethylallyltransferase
VSGADGESRFAAQAARVERVVRDLEASPARLVCVVGPTASGKTELAIAIAEAIGGEIVSADSVQIYRGFDIGSGKATAEERARARHHLIDTHDPHEGVDAAAWAELAERAIQDVRARGKVPVVCGGTFFWVRALVLGLAAAPAADEAIRARHRERVAREGNASLHAALAEIDAASAARLHPNDVLRVSRALEVFELSGKPMSAWQEEHGFREKKHDAMLVGPEVSPEELTARIGRRVDAWLSGGWIDEVRDLIARGHGDARAMTSVGYAEVKEHLAGNIAREALRETIVRSTRIFVRRQRTWLRSADVRWI